MPSFPRRRTVILIIFALFLAPILARAALYAFGSDHAFLAHRRLVQHQDAAAGRRLSTGAAGGVHRHHRRLEGHFLGA